MSRWGTAIWGTDTWDALTVAELCQRPPATDRGVLIGHGDWKLVVEALLPSDGPSIWGVGVWGEAQWNVLAWQDLTPYVRGLEWTRGSDEPYGRPRVGDVTVTLLSIDNRWNPWNPTPPTGSPAYFSCGTIIRVGVRSASDTRASGWLPQITAIVDEWTPQYLGDGGDQYVDVLAVETLRDLATIDDNALPGVVGGGESPQDRFERLLDNADWKYGLKIEAQNIISTPSAYPMQSTDMADNRISECYLTADSCDVQFRTDRTGAALVTNIEYVGVVGAADAEMLPLVDFGESATGFPRLGFDYFEHAHWSGDYWYLQYAQGGFETTNSDDSVINEARFARAGGTQQTFQQDASVQRYGRRTMVRNDFVCNNDTVVAQQAQYMTIRRGLNTLRVNNMEIIVTAASERAALTALAADVQSSCVVFSPDGGEFVVDAFGEIVVDGDGNPTFTGATRPYIFGYVASMTHKVTPGATDKLTWIASFGVDTRTVFNLPAAQLPATPA